MLAKSNLFRPAHKIPEHGPVGRPVHARSLFEIEARVGPERQAGEQERATGSDDRHHLIYTTMHPNEMDTRRPFAHTSSSASLGGPQREGG